MTTSKSLGIFVQKYVKIIFMYRVNFTDSKNVPEF